MNGLMLRGLEGKVAVVTGAGRMRSIGRPIAVELARAGCDIALTGTGRAPERYPDDEKAAGWQDIDSVAEEVRALGRRAIAVVSDVSDATAVEVLAQTVLPNSGASTSSSTTRARPEGPIACRSSILRPNCGALSST